MAGARTSDVRHVRVHVHGAADAVATVDLDDAAGAPDVAHDRRADVAEPATGHRRGDAGVARAPGELDTGSTLTNEKVTATVEHEFWVDGRGWTPASQLVAGDWLSDSDGSRSQVVGMKRVPGKATVYTFVNQADHAFYANGVLVRDSCGDKSAFYQQTKPSVPELKEVAR